MNKRTIIKIGGFVLCVLFFTVPLVQCSQDSNIAASGLQIATGTGELMNQSGKFYPFVFLSLTIPMALIVLAFVKASFSILRIISIEGLAVHTIFMIVAYVMLNSGKGDDAIHNGTFEFTIFNWLVLGIYIGLVCFAHYCIKQESKEEKAAQG